MVTAMIRVACAPLVQQLGRAQRLCDALAEARLEQRRVKESVCRILLAHQLVNTGRLDREHGAQLMAHKGGRVKRKENK